MLGSAATLLGDAAELDPAEMREFHRIMRDQAGHMWGFVGDLLDADRLEAGTLSVSPEPSNAVRLIARARTAFVGAGGRHAVTIDLPPDWRRSAPMCSPTALGTRRASVEVLADRGPFGADPSCRGR